MKNFLVKVLEKIKENQKILPMFLLGFVFVVAGIFGGNTNSKAAITKYLNYQAKILDSSGVAVPDGSYDVVFRICITDDCSDPTDPVWTETWNAAGTEQVSVTDGLFSVLLGKHTALDLDFNGSEYYLGVNFNGDGEMTPLKRIVGAPYAINTDLYQGLDLTSLDNNFTLKGDASSSRTITIGQTAANADNVVIDSANWTMASTGALVIAPTAALTTAIDLTDTDITNAINIGTNKILGTTGVIDFTDFDVSDDGAVTLAPDDGGTGITITPGAALTTGLDVSNGSITNAVSVGSNTITGSEAVIDFTDFDVSADGLITIANDADGVGLTISPSGATTTAINVSDGNITNAINIGANKILGTTGTIDFNLFDVAATGAITVANGADVVGLTIAPTIATTTAIDVSDSDITNAVSVGANTITGTTAVIDFTDFNVDADGLVTLAPDGGGTGITITPSAGLTTALDASDAEITNALSIGANTITGTTGAIDFNLFDVAATGAITVANSADVVGLTIAPTIATATAIDVSDTDITNALSIGSNTITGTTGAIDYTYFDVAATSGAVTLTRQATGTSPLTITGIANATTADIDLNTQNNQGTVIDVDWMAETQEGATTGLSIDFSNLTDDNTNTIYGLHVNDFNAAGGGGGTQYGLYIQGTNWDFGIFTEDVIGIANSGNTGTLQATLTGDKVWTLPDTTGTIALTSDIPAGASLWETDATSTYEDDDDVFVGATSETITNAGFSPDGDDFFVAGDAGIAGDVYTNSSFIAGASLTLSDAGITDSNSDLAFTSTTDGFTFTFTDSGAGDDFAIDSTVFVVESDDDQVGIGTANPSTLLEVSGGTSTFTLGAGSQVLIDAASTDHTGTEGALRVNVDTATDSNYGLYIDYQTVDDGGADTVYAGYITIDNDSTTVDDTVYGLYVESLDSADDDADKVADHLIYINNADTNNPVGAGITIAAAAGGITTAVDASDAEITNALSVGANTITGTTGVIDFDLFGVAATGAITIVNGANVAGLTIAPTVATTTAIDLTDTDITNAINIGTNKILGTTGVIDFTDFDVSADGNVTIASDDGNTALTVSTDEYTQDIVSITGQAADTDGIDVAFTLVNDDNVDTIGAISLNITSANTGDADVLAGLLVNNVSSADGTVNEYGIYVAGSDWDYGLVVDDAAKYTLGAAEQILIDANSTNHTDTSGVIDLNLTTGGTGVKGINVDLASGADLGAAESIVGYNIGLTNRLNDHASSSVVGYSADITADNGGGLMIAYYAGTGFDDTDEYAFYSDSGEVTYKVGAAQKVYIDATTTSHTNADGVFLIQAAADTAGFEGIYTSTTSQGDYNNVVGIRSDITSGGMTGGTDTNSGFYASVTNNAGDLLGSGIAGFNADATDAGGLGSLVAYRAGDNFDYSIYVASGTAYFTGNSYIHMVNSDGPGWDVRLASSTQTDNFNSIGINLTIEDDADVGETYTGLDVAITNNSEVVDADNVYGINVENLGVNNTDGKNYGIYQSGTNWEFGLYVEDSVKFDFGSATNNFQIDAATTDNTSTAGVLDLDIDTKTDTNKGLSIDYEVLDADADSQTFYAQYMALTVDADADNTGSTIKGLYITTTNNEDTSTVYGIEVADISDSGDGNSTVAIGQTGDTWDFGLYISDTAHFEKKVEIGYSNDSDALFDVQLGAAQRVRIDAATNNSTVASRGLFLIDANTSTDGNAAQYIEYDIADDDTNSESFYALRIATNMSGTYNDSDSLYGIYIDNVAGSPSNTTNYAIYQAAGGDWNYSLYTTSVAHLSGGVATLAKTGDCGDGDFTTAVDGLLCVDDTGGSEQLWFRAGGSWYFINKSGSFWVTKNEVIDPNGHNLKPGDTVIGRLDFDTVDGQIHGIYEYFDFDSLVDDINLLKGKILSTPSYKNNLPISGLHWSIDDYGVLTSSIPVMGGYNKEVYNTASTEAEITLSGKAQLSAGYAKVLFKDFDENYEDVILADEDLRIIITPTTDDLNFRGITVVKKRQKAKDGHMVWEGFEAKELGGGVSDATFDWMAIGRRVGYGDIKGCMDPAAENYNPSATADDESCLYLDSASESAGEDDSAGSETPDPLEESPGSEENSPETNGEISGCMNEEAENYNPNATEDDGSCSSYDEESLPADVSAEEAEEEGEYSEESSEPVFGCTDPEASNYNESATEDDGGCAYNNNSSETQDQNEILGCMDKTATNYNPDATEDDGSCLYPE